jgi:hypothetical protein
LRASAYKGVAQFAHHAFGSRSVNIGIGAVEIAQGFLEAAMAGLKYEPGVYLRPLVRREVRNSALNKPESLRWCSASAWPVTTCRCINRRRASWRRLLRPRLLLNSSNVGIGVEIVTERVILTILFDARGESQPILRSVVRLRTLR